MPRNWFLEQLLQSFCLIRPCQTSHTGTYRKGVVVHGVVIKREVTSVALLEDEREVINARHVGRTGWLLVAWVVRERVDHDTAISWARDEVLAWLNKVEVRAITGSETLVRVVLEENRREWVHTAWRRNTGGDRHRLGGRECRTNTVTKGLNRGTIRGVGLEIVRVSIVGAANWAGSPGEELDWVRELKTDGLSRRGDVVTRRVLKLLNKVVAWSTGNDLTLGGTEVDHGREELNLGTWALGKSKVTRAEG